MIEVGVKIAIKLLLGVAGIVKLGAAYLISTASIAETRKTLETNLIMLPILTKSDEYSGSTTPGDATGSPQSSRCPPACLRLV